MDLGVVQDRLGWNSVSEVGEEAGVEVVGLIVSTRVDHISQIAETPLTWFKDQKWINNAEKANFHVFACIK